MRPLLFVNWRQVSTRFTVLMWLIACALAVIVLLHLPGGGTAASASTSAGASRLAVPQLAAPMTRSRR